MRTLVGTLIGFVVLPVAALDCSVPAPTPAVHGGSVAPGPGLQGNAGLDAATLFDGGGDLTVTAVLARIHDERCASAPAADGYQKQTEFDNTPYRFNMRPGQKLSAAEFDAWMESRGIRIVKAKDESAEPAATPVVAQ